MTNEEWLNLIEQAYRLPIREDIRADKWDKLKFDEKEKLFLLSKYSKEYANQHQEHILKIVQVFTRYFFKKALKGETFCDPSKIKKEFGKTLEQHYNVSSGPFLNFAYTYWTFRFQLDEDQYTKLKEHVPLFFPILRTAEMNIAGSFFPSGGHVSAENQRQILNEYAPEINIERFLSDNPLISRKSGCLGSVLFLLLLTIILIWLSV
ncbi:hypothetical protein H8E88_00490 [candidate division KSB1 bacterium]|nr:hypothetical protein [candidate division KSB1 bacterium]